MGLIQDMVKSLGKIQLEADEHSPELLIAAGIGGMIFTCVKLVQATIKSVDDVEVAKLEQNKKELPAKEVVKASWKNYILPAVTGTASIVCFVRSVSISTGRIAALTAAYTISESTFTQYRERVKEKFGEKKENAVWDDISKEEVKKHPTDEDDVIVTGKGHMKCYDLWNGRAFWSDVETIRRAERDFNVMLSREDYGSLNLFYDYILLPPIDERVGESIGWNNNNRLRIEFSSVLDEAEHPCLVMRFANPPKYGFDKNYF